MLSDSIPASSARVIAALSTRSLLSGMRGFAFAPVFLAIRVHLDNLHRTWETYAVRLRRNQTRRDPWSHQSPYALSLRQQRTPKASTIARRRPAQPSGKR